MATDQDKPKRKRDASGTGGHVRPALGRNARRARMEARREARRTRLREQDPDYEPPSSPLNIKPMMPRLGTWQRNKPSIFGSKNTPRLEERPAERVRPKGLVWLSWRWVSGIMTAGLIILLVILLSADAFYVSSVAVGGVNYLSREEVFRFSGVSQQHIFWLDAEDLKAQLEANNNIASAEVRLGWPPQAVQIIIQEREPVLVWEQGSDRVWVDINGWVMFQREDRPDLLRVVYDPEEMPEGSVIEPNSRLDPELIEGALLVKSRLPNIQVLLYHPIKGLGWRDPRGWMAWFGVGDNMAMKAHVYDALVNYNLNRLQFAEVDVSDPDNPVYSVLWYKSEDGTQTQP